MKVSTLHSEIGPDKTLRLEIPCDLPPGPVEVVVVLQPSAASSKPTGPPDQVRSGLFVGKADPSVDVDEVLKEMNDAWKAKLEDLHS